MPIALIPSSLAAKSVEPDPQKGSSSVGLPGGAISLIMYFMSAMGLTVGWLFCLGILLSETLNPCPFFASAEYTESFKDIPSNPALRSLLEALAQ